MRSARGASAGDSVCSSDYKLQYHAYTLHTRAGTSGWGQGVQPVEEVLPGLRQHLPSHQHRHHMLRWIVRSA